MSELLKLFFQYLTIKEQADNLYKQAKQLEKDYMAIYDKLKDECQRTGKTINDLEE